MCNILLVDMNSFYASVHQALDPAIRDKPVIVCGDPNRRHGIVLASSYEAKRFGVKTGMPNWEAKKLVPDGIYIAPDHKKYADFSRRILSVMRDFSPLVEPFSIDEAYIDVTGCGRFGTSTEIAGQIKNRIREEVGVLCSVGIGPNKLVAKMAAELQKPDGLTVLTKEDVPRKLWPLPVKQLFGVGAKTENKLILLGVYTIGDLAAFPPDILEMHFGSNGRVIHMSANGIDHSRVNPHSHDTVKSVGHQFTLSRDYVGEEIKTGIIELTERVGFRLRQGGYSGRTVSLFLRDTSFGNHTFSTSLAESTDITETIARTAVRLFEKNWPKHKRVRLIGITVSNLTRNKYEQVEMFTDNDKLRNLDEACDSIKKRFGSGSIVRAISLK